MVVKKLSVSIESGMTDEIIRDARAAGMSVSAWLTEAAAAKLRTSAWREYVDDYEREFGAFTEEEREQARRDLGISSGGERT